MHLHQSTQSFKKILEDHELCSKELEFLRFFFFFSQEFYISYTQNLFSCINRKKYHCRYSLLFSVLYLSLCMRKWHSKLTLCWNRRQSCLSRAFLRIVLCTQKSCSTLISASDFCLEIYLFWLQRIVQSLFVLSLYHSIHFWDWGNFLINHLNILLQTCRKHFCFFCLFRQYIICLRNYFSQQEWMKDCRFLCITGLSKTSMIFSLSLITLSTAPATRFLKQSHDFYCLCFTLLLFGIRQFLCSTSLKCIIAVSLPFTFCYKDLRKTASADASEIL